MFYNNYNSNNFNNNVMKLGDKLEWLFKVTGIKWLVKKINPNCNCEFRKNKLNEFKFKRK
jgi:hypothetical protein